MKKKLAFLTAIMLMVSVCASCATVEEPPVVAVDTEESVMTYSLVTAELDDVLLTKKITSYYAKNNDEEVSFDVTGKYVDKVYVREGQAVKKGDLLCELSYASISDEISSLTYRIQRNELLLSYTYTDETLDKQDQWVSAMSNSYLSDEDILKRCDEIAESYERQRVLLNDSLEFDREKLAAKKKELSASRLYASMDGTVYKIKDNLEGSTSKAGTVIMTIVGNDEGLFVVKDISDANLIHEGDKLDMKVSFSGAAGDYVITPENMDLWTDTMMFSIYSAPEGAALAVGASGTVTIVVDKRENVLSLPLSVVHIANDKAFVYTLNENNDREIRYIEIGLKGDDRVEILSGLTEGEKVVKK